LPRRGFLPGFGRALPVGGADGLGVTERPAVRPRLGPGRLRTSEDRVARRGAGHPIGARTGHVRGFLACETRRPRRARTGATFFGRNPPVDRSLLCVWPPGLAVDHAV